MAYLLRIFLCLSVLGVCLYAYIDRQNGLTELRLKIPAVAKQLRAIVEENQRLEYEIDRFESPVHLMQLAAEPQFSHLKHPFNNEVVVLDGVPAAPIERSRHLSDAAWESEEAVR